MEYIPESIAIKVAKNCIAGCIVAKDIAAKKALTIDK